jgi:hypothetical protein
MLFQQMHIGHRHATVHGFAHIVNSQQGHLHGGEGFNKINNLRASQKSFEQHPEWLVGQNLDKMSCPLTV